MILSLVNRPDIRNSSYNSKQSGHRALCDDESWSPVFTSIKEQSFDHVPADSFGSGFLLQSVRQEPLTLLTSHRRWSKKISELFLNWAGQIKAWHTLKIKGNSGNSATHQNWLFNSHLTSGKRSLHFIHQITNMSVNTESREIIVNNFEELWNRDKQVWISIKSEQRPNSSRPMLE